MFMRESKLALIGKSDVYGIEISYYKVDLNEEKLEFIVRIHPKKYLKDELFELLLLSEIFPFEILKVYEMWEKGKPRIIQFSKTIPQELIDIEKNKFETKLKKAIESIQNPKKRKILLLAKQKLEQLKTNPEKNRREIELLLMGINEILFYR